ncbi:MAG: hypothetical protein ACFFA6_04670 [Promethearchaeota archaeon]
MTDRKNMKKNVVILIILIFSIFQIANLNLINNSEKSDNLENVKTSADESFQEQWISNPNFVSSDNWTSSKGAFGDPNDINAYIGGGSANFEVLGKKTTYSFVETPPIGSNWLAVPNPEFPHGPSSNFSDSEGLKVYHEFDDHDANQNPSVHWDRNLTMPVSMSDYEITSASIHAVVNATVDEDVDCSGDTSATDGGAPLNQQESYDYVRFYVLISDLPKDKVYEIAYLQPSDLGAGNPPGDDTLLDTDLIPDLQEDIMYALTSVLSTDYFNFTLTLGIRIYTADNSDTYDNDEFHELLIKSVNLTFTYEKTINQQTSASWNQVGKKISDSITISPYIDFEVTEALLNFDYKVNDTWTSASLNSEISILMNNIKHTETIKLSTATTIFQKASIDGFDLTSLISDDVNLSIQVFLANDFELDKIITVSITNISLDISYTVEFNDYPTNLQVFLNGVESTSFELPLHENLTITVKYTNQTGGHLEDANVRFTMGLIDNLTQNADNYSITFNVTTRLDLYDNSLKIRAQKRNYVTQELQINVYVRKINVEIITVSGEDTININSGEDASLEIMLNDTDNDKLIEGAIVTYEQSWDAKQDFLTEDNGIYEATITNPPDGYGKTITISAIVGSDYEVINQDFGITLNVGVFIPPEPGPDLGWLISLLIYVFSGVIIGVALLFTMYIKIWRYPPLVRKIRALRKKVYKGKKTKPMLVKNRGEIVADNIKNNQTLLSIESIQPEKIDKIEKSNVNEEGVN